MDAFFASVEQRDLPYLRGRSVIVGGSREGRGVVAAASYEAREYGIHSAMSMAMAIKLCPDAVFIEGNIDKYIDACRRIFDLCSRCCDTLEIVSIDEVYLLFREKWNVVVERSAMLKEKVYAETGLICSMGVAPNRILAKLASSMEKPNGFTILLPKDLPGSIAFLPVSRLWGIGKKTASLFKADDITTIGELLTAEEWRIRAHLGTQGFDLIKTVCGAPDKPLPPTKEKSLGHEFTFHKDLEPYGYFWSEVRRLCDQVSRRLRVNHYQGRIVRVKLRWKSFETHTHQMVSNTDLQNPFNLYRVASRLIHDLLKPRRKIRLVGVTVAEIYDAIETDLLHVIFPEVRVQQKLISAIDTIWDRYGEESLIRASLIPARARGFTGVSAPFFASSSPA